MIEAQCAYLFSVRVFLLDLMRYIFSPMLTVETLIQLNIDGMSSIYDFDTFWSFLVEVIGWCILMDLKIQTKSSVIGSVILKYVLKSCVIRLMIHKF